MNGVRTMYFIALAALMLVAPLLCWHLEERPAVSYLEGRERPELAGLTWSAVRTGETQSAFDAALAFDMPHRDEALLAHARRQRRLIGLAARLFGFDAWPTFYGSRHCHVQSADAIAEIPRKASLQERKRFESIAREYAELMAAHPDVRWFLALVDAPAFSLAGPLHDLVSDPLDYEWCRRHFLARLPKSCTIIDLGYAGGGGADALYRDYFRTDHHWRIQGAVRAYGRIAERLGIAPIEFGPPLPVTAPEFFGSQARQGLDADVAGDAIFDVAYERSPLRVEVQGETTSISALDLARTVFLSTGSRRFADWYNGYFPASGQELHFFNEEATGGILAIVGTSYLQCMERFFAETYREIYRTTSTLRLTEFLKFHHVDDVLLLFSPSKLP